MMELAARPIKKVMEAKVLLSNLANYPIQNQKRRSAALNNLVSRTCFCMRLLGVRGRGTGALYCATPYLRAAQYWHVYDATRRLRAVRYLGTRSAVLRSEMVRAGAEEAEGGASSTEAEQQGRRSPPPRAQPARCRPLLLAYATGLCYWPQLLAYVISL